MNRKKWDEEYLSLLEEQEELEYSKEVTTYVIAGRVSFYNVAKKALESGMGFDTFISVMKTILQDEIKEGQINAETFEIPTDTTDIDDWLS